MEQLACGEMGLTIDYFYDLTPREFDNIAKGYRDRKKYEFQNGWEQFRELMFTVSAPHFTKKSKGMTIEQFRPFPWDKKDKKPIRTPEQVKAIFEKWDKQKTM